MARASEEHRRLAAVLVADIVAYSRLMARKEADTYYRVKDLQSSVIVPAVERNHGRVVKWTGDGFISTFASAVDAVRTAVEIQSGAVAAGASTPEDLRIRFRIGVNVGDLIVASDDVYGNVVNIAVRLQTAAAPEGICVSRGVRDAVNGKVSIDFENRGELEVKNIPEPVGAYGVVFDPVAWTMEPARPEPVRSTRLKWTIVGAAVIMFLIAGLWFAFERYDVLNSQNFQEELRSRMRSSSPDAPPQAVEVVARNYHQGGEHKALAASRVPPRFWLTIGRPSADLASEAVLESCQVAFGAPCTLIAINGVLRSQAPSDMPRARYSGSFAPEQIPAANAATRSRVDVARYRATPGPKAIAYTPSGGRVFVVVGGDSQRAVEEKALDDCLADPVRANFNAPCFLYAVGDLVILPLRRQEPFTQPSP